MAKPYCVSINSLFKTISVYLENSHLSQPSTRSEQLTEMHFTEGHEREAGKVWVLVQSFQEREAQQVVKITMRKREDFGCCCLSPAEQRKQG